MGLRMENFNILGFHWNIQLLGGSSQKTNIEGVGGLPKKGGLDSLQISGTWQEREGGVFEGGGWSLMHTMSQHFHCHKWYSHLLICKKFMHTNIFTLLYWLNNNFSVCKSMFKVSKVYIVCHAVLLLYFCLLCCIIVIFCILKIVKGRIIIFHMFLTGGIHNNWSTTHKNEWLQYCFLSMLVYLLL